MDPSRPHTPSSSDESPLEELAETTLPGDTTGGGPDASPADAELERGSTVGRYTVLEKIGAGGMGVVYAAFDPQLDRKVALKVMHPGSGGSSSSLGGRQRLLREAQAMAKLSHPNVITVHDVGTFGDRVFVAMEFIEGRTLRDWLDPERREWSEAVDAFVRAGRGLAAAHAAGLVHRDFKPDNVLIGNDGRVLVMDFGLAREAAARTTPVDPDASTQTGVAVPREELVLTRTGALLGTPAYMAPEQHTGAPVGAAADQFSFCVALWEGLYGQRPFGGNSLTSLAMNKLEGRLRMPPRNARVPAWIRDVLLRGLSIDPDDRYPSMDVLLAELQRDPPETRRPWVVATVAGVVATSITGIYLASRTQEATGCDDADARLARVWNDARRRDVRAALTGTELSYATPTWQSVEGLIDAYAEDWTAVYTGACEADQRRRSKERSRTPEPSLVCATRRLDQLDALLHAYTSAPDTAVVDHAVGAAQDLAPVELCAGLDPLSAGESVVDPDARDRARALRSELAAAWALQRTGRPREALERSVRLVSVASSLDVPRLEAEVLLLVARAQYDVGEHSGAERSLRRAILSAATANHDDIEAEAWVSMVEIVAFGRGELAEGRRLALAAESAIQRAGEPPRLRAELLVILGALDKAEGNHEAALEHFEQALQIRRGRLDPSHLDIASAHDGVGMALEGLGRYLEAIDHHGRALTLREQVLGARHPDCGISLSHLGAAMHGAHRDRAAEASFVRARMILDPNGVVSVDDLPEPSGSAPIEPETRIHPRHPVELAIVLDRMGLAMRTDEKLEEAARLHARAAALLENASGSTRRDLLYPLGNLGLALSDLGRHADAVPHLRRALEIAEATLSKNHPDRGSIHVNLANALWAAGELEKSREHYAHALQIWEESLAVDHPLLGYALTGLGRTRGAAGHAPLAVDLLERALEIRDHDDEDRLNLAETTLLLGRALWAEQRDPQRAVELAIRTRDLLQATPPADPFELERLLSGAEVPGLTDRLVPAGLGLTNRSRSPR